MRIVALLFLVSCAHAPGAGRSDGRLRVLVLTDIGGDTDDQQSMVRFLAYANEFDVEGLIATSRLRHGKDVKPGILRELVRAYGKVRPNLVLHDPRYPPEEDLLSKIKAGQPDADESPATPFLVGEGRDTEGSEWILRVLERPDPRPVWVIVWGGGSDLAQALWRSPRLASRVRVYAIHDQDGAMAWIEKEIPGVFMIVPREVYRGMYQAGDTSLCTREWVNAHVRTGHGPLGALYPEDGHGVKGLKEGDTPSLLYLLPNGLGLPDAPEAGSWGGRFRKEGNRFVDGEDAAGPDPRVNRRWTVARWRPAYQNDFEARMDWQVKPFAEANHPPLAHVEVRGFALDASGSTDPDGDHLTFAWFVYAEAGAATRLTSEGARAKVEPPLSGTAHVIVAVTDSGRPPLTRYRRILLPK